MSEPQQPETDRSPPGSIYTEEDQDEGNWSDTPSEREECQNEIARHKVEAPSDINLGRRRNPHSHLSRRWDLGDNLNREDTTSDGTGHQGHQGSPASGQIIPYIPYHDRYVCPPITWDPFSTTRPSASPFSPKPLTPYPADPFPPPPPLPYPADPRPKLGRRIIETRSMSMPEGPLGNDKRVLFLYEPLNVESYEIRLLSISPATLSSPVICTMDTVDLFAPGEYTALSYCWGDPKATIDIVINDAQLAVTTNLHEALRHLRKETETVRVWADAVCINQTDRQERSLQVRLMKNIYSLSERVIAWAGPESALSTAAISLLTGKAADVNTQIAPQHSVSRSATPPPSITESETLTNFFQLPYWKRVWIIQEVAVGSSVYVLCGNHMMQWEDLGKLDQFMRPEDQPNHVKQIQKFREKIQSGGQISLLEAMFASREALATDKRDKVFALLGLCYDADKLIPIPNYKQSVTEILRDLTRAIIAKTRCLDYILFNTRQEMEGYPGPSWLLDWIGVRSDPKDLLSAQLKESDLYYLGNKQDPDTLCVRGHIIGTVTRFDDGKAPTSRQRHSLTDSSYRKYAIEAIFESLCLRSISDEEYPYIKRFFSTLWVEDGRVAPDRHPQILRCMRERSLPTAAPLGLAYQRRPSTDSSIGQGDAAAIQKAARYQERQFIDWLEDDKELATIRFLLQKFQILGAFTDKTGLFMNLFSRAKSIAAPSITELEFQIIESLQTIAQNQMKLLNTIESTIYIGHALVEPGDIICQLDGFTKLVVLRPKSDLGMPIFKVVGGAEKYRSTVTDHEVGKRPPSLFVLA